MARHPSSHRPKKLPKQASSTARKRAFGKRGKAKRKAK